MQVQESVNGKLFVVDYDENLWFRLPEDRQKFCFEDWAKRAAPLKCNTVVLRLHPDEFFPLHGNEKPYVARSVPIANAAPALMRSKTVCYVELTDAWARMPEGPEKLAARQKARDIGLRSGCDSWEVWQDRHKRLDSGYNTQTGQYGIGRG